MKIQVNESTIIPFNSSKEEEIINTIGDFTTKYYKDDGEGPWFDLETELRKYGVTPIEDGYYVFDESRYDSSKRDEITAELEKFYTEEFLSLSGFKSSVNRARNYLDKNNISYSRSGVDNLGRYYFKKGEDLICMIDKSGRIVMYTPWEL